MLKAASLNVRVKPDTRNRLDKLALVTRRSKSYVIEEAIDWIRKLTYLCRPLFNPTNILLRRTQPRRPPC